MQESFQLLPFPGKKTFESVYASKFPFVLFVLRKLGVGQNEIEELAQDVFLAYFRHRSGIGPEKVNAWLATTARNLAFDSFRKRKSRKTHCDEDAVGRAMVSVFEQGDDSERAVKASLLEEDLRSWSQRQPRRILADFYLRGKSVKELSETHGLRVSSVTSALTRQRREFRASLRNR